MLSSAIVFIENCGQPMKLRTRIFQADIASICFYGALFIWIVASIFTYTSFYGAQLQGTPYIAIRLCCLAALAFGELFSSKHSVSSMALVAAILIGSALMGDRINGRVLDGLLFVYCARNYPFRKAAVVSLVAIILACLTVLVGVQAGWISDFVEYTASRTRHYLGFRYSLFPSMYLFTGSCLWIYLRNTRIGFADAVVLLLLNWGLYRLTDSRLSFYLSIGIVVLALVMRFTKGKLSLSKPVGLLCCLSFACCAFVVIWLTISYSPSVSWMASLDHALSNRLSLGQNALNTYGILPLGQSINFIGNGLDAAGNKATGVYNYVDSLYVQLLVKYGFILFALFIAAFTYLSFKAWQHGDPYLLLVLVFSAFHCIIDDLMLYLYFDPFLLLMGSIVAADLAAYRRSQSPVREKARRDGALNQA